MILFLARPPSLSCGLPERSLAAGRRVPGDADATCGTARGAAHQLPPVAGFYLNWMKIAAMWAGVRGLGGVADWVNRDMDENNLNWQMWNPIVVGSFLAMLLLTWIIPWFWLNIFLLLDARSRRWRPTSSTATAKCPATSTVLTRAHLRFWLSERMKTIGVKVAAEAADPNTGGVPVKVYARGGGTRRSTAPDCWPRGRRPACRWPARCSTRA